MNTVGATRRFMRAYAIRILIGAVLVASGSTAVFVVVPYQRELRIARRIEANGGDIGWAYSGPKWLPQSIQAKLYVWYRIEDVELTDGFRDPIHGNVIGSTTKAVPIEVFYALGTLTNVKTLCLAYTDLDDAGLKHLAAMTTLEDLDLTGTKITDGGLEHFKLLQRLRFLDLVGTGVSENGEAAITKVLPSCNIYVMRRPQ